MAVSLREKAQEGGGRKTDLSFLRAEQAELFEPAKPTWAAFLKWLLRTSVKPVAVRIYGGDPEQAADNLYRILEGRHNRHFAIGWLDHVVEEMPEAAEAIVRFVCDRYGYEMPAKKPDRVRVQEELHAVKETLAQAVIAVEQATKALSRIEGAK